mmetsp:Transcript_14470/g.25247  ORF Transcript_14470/g.25247 Transcript_14470/m.25247 type:complete len:300 (+) Transcript_14470:879-1778(+)
MAISAPRPAPRPARGASPPRPPRPALKAGRPPSPRPSPRPRPEKGRSPRPPPSTRPSPPRPPKPRPSPRPEKGRSPRPPPSPRPPRPRPRPPSPRPPSLLVSAMRKPVSTTFLTGLTSFTSSLLAPLMAFFTVISRPSKFNSVSLRTKVFMPLNSSMEMLLTSAALFRAAFFSAINTSYSCMVISSISGSAGTSTTASTAGASPSGEGEGEAASSLGSESTAFDSSPSVPQLPTPAPPRLTPSWPRPVPSRRSYSRLGRPSMSGEPRPPRPRPGRSPRPPRPPGPSMAAELRPSGAPPF